jgi:hypothetical protein
MADHTPTPREHELPNGDLAVSSHWVWGTRDATTVAEADRPLYRLLMDVLADAHIPDCMPARLATACDDLVDARETVMDIERGVVDVENVGYGMSYCHKVRDAIDAHRDRDPLRLAAVGCSGSKYEDAEPMAAKERYKGAYWSNKRGYGELRDDWRVISAEHDVLHPEAPIAYYERTPDEWRGVPVHSNARLPSGDPVDTRLDQWALDVYDGLSAWIDGVTDDVDPRNVELEALLGRPYRDPLAERGVFDALRAPGDLTVSFPFQEVEQAQGGMFEQIGWMSDEIAAATVATDGGSTDGDE